MVAEGLASGVGMERGLLSVHILDGGGCRAVLYRWDSCQPINKKLLFFSWFG
jgi:hypothetical protein